MACISHVRWRGFYNVGEGGGGLQLGVEVLWIPVWWYVVTREFKCQQCGRSHLLQGRWSEKRFEVLDQLHVPTKSKQ